MNDLLWLIVENDLPTELDPATETSIDEEQTNTEDSKSTTPGTGATATSTVTQTVTASVISSRVQLEVHRVENVVVTDASGVVSFESTDDRTVTGAIEVCPNTLGVSNAKMRTTVSIDATTHPGAAGRVGVHVVGHAETTSDFTGNVDDSAALRNVTQTFHKSSDWKRSAAADGGPVREQSGTLDVAFDGLPTTANAAGEVGVAGMSAAGMTGTAGVTGTGTQKMINNSVGDPAIDVVSISPSYREAQRLWRNGRCVVVAIPGYNAETSIHTEAQETSQHTENVDQGSSTEFTASEHHRFESTPLTTEINAQLTAGDKTLDPDSLPHGTGALTYVAPDENGKDATVELVSMSNPRHRDARRHLPHRISPSSRMARSRGRDSRKQSAPSVRAAGDHRDRHHLCDGHPGSGGGRHAGRLDDPIAEDPQQRRRHVLLRDAGSGHRLRAAGHGLRIRQRPRPDHRAGRGRHEIGARERNRRPDRGHRRGGDHRRRVTKAPARPEGLEPPTV